MYTSAGLDQENNAPDKAKETQSTGVPAWKYTEVWIYEL